jgi:hypothetical protein
MHNPVKGDQASLFPEENKPSQKSHLHEQLVKLGDMMGDGLHHESDGKWIPKEYNKVLRALEPEIFKEKRKRKAEALNKKMITLLLSKRCTCGGVLTQSRSGSKIAYCTVCDKRYKAVPNKSSK